MKKFFLKIYIDQKIEKKDGWIAFALLAIYAIFMYIELKVIPRDSKYIYIQIGLALIWLLIIVGILKLRKQPLASIGIHRQAAPLIMIGAITVISIIYAIIHSDLEILGRWLFYLIAVGSIEEILFRGFAYPRIHKLTNNHWSTLLITGALFGAFHHIAPMVWNNAPLIGVLNELGGGILGSFFFLFVYVKTGNLLNAIILHAVLDYTSIPWLTGAGFAYIIILLFINRYEVKERALY